MMSFSVPGSKIVESGGFREIKTKGKFSSLVKSFALARLKRLCNEDVGLIYPLHFFDCVFAKLML